MKKMLASLAASAALLGGGLALTLAPTVAHASTVLAGSTSIAANDDSISRTNPTGNCDSEAFQFTASATGTAATEVVYLTGTVGADVGIYSDNGSDRASTLLGHGLVTSNTANSWVSISLQNTVSITNGTKYWLSIGSYPLGQVGGSCATVNFRDTASGTNNDWADVGDGGSPASFTSDTQYSNSPASIYVQTA